jgi:hypothetical protein
MTHIPIDLNSVDWDNYIRAAVQEGSGVGISHQYFTGTKYQRGFGMVSNVMKFLAPVAKNFAHSIGKEGIEAGTRVLKDISEGRNINESLQEHSRKGLSNLSGRVKQCGKGGGGKRRRKATKQRAAPLNSFIASQEVNNGNVPLPKKGRQRRRDQLDI